MTLQEASMFVVNFKKYSCFDEKIVEEAFAEFEAKLFQREVITRNKAYYEKAGYPMIGEGSYEFEEEKGDWKRKVRDYGYKFLIPSQYQTDESKILRRCLCLQFPYLELFDFDCYHLDKENDEFYIRSSTDVDYKSLYVPIMALFKNSSQMIKDRMNNYFNSYYGGKGREKYLENALSAMEDEKAKFLFQILDDDEVRQKAIQNGLAKKQRTNIKKIQHITVLDFIDKLNKSKLKYMKGYIDDIRPICKDGEKGFEFRIRNEKGKAERLFMTTPIPEKELSVKENFLLGEYEGLKALKKQAKSEDLEEIDRLLEENWNVCDGTCEDENKYHNDTRNIFVKYGYTFDEEGNML